MTIHELIVPSYRILLFTPNIHLYKLIIGMKAGRSVDIHPLAGGILYSLPCYGIEQYMHQMR